MDSFSSFPSFGVDSQPSQILKEVLGGVTDLPTDTAATQDNSWTDDNSHASASRVAPQYHYHGLATTQSQFDDSHAEESSQKENAPASAENSNILITNQHSSMSSSKNSSKPIVTSRAASVPEAPPSPCIPKAAKAVSFISPRHITTSQANLRQSFSLQSPPFCRRSLSPASQDSFAGPPFRKDPEQEFLAASKQFGVPLSELGTFPEDPMFSGKTVVSSTNVHNESISATRSQESDEFHSQESDAATGFRTTDSQHMESQPQGQYDMNYDDYIVNNHNRDVFIKRDSQFGVQSEDSPQPSSSSDGIYTEVPTQLVEEPTQIIEESTQPMNEPTQIINQQVQAMHPIEEELTQLVLSPIPPSVTIQTPATVTSTTTSTNPHSLYHMVNANKKWRLQGISIPPSAIHPAVRATQAETQPSRYELVALNAPVDHVVSHQNTPPPAPVPVPMSKLPQAMVEEDDVVDIVPDSEPPRDDAASSERRTSPSRPMLLVFPEVEDEIVPDSVEEDQLPPPTSLSHLSDEDDDDRPLAAFMPRSGSRRNGIGKRRAVYVEDSDSESDRPLAMQIFAQESEEPPLPPPAKKRKLDVPVTPVPRATRSHKAQALVAPALTKAKPKKSAPKARGKGKRKPRDNASESISRKQTPASVEEDAKTEPAAEEDYMDMSFIPEDVGPSKKRKRVGSTATKVPNFKSRSATSITPLTRSTKLRSAPGSLKGRSVDATRVFARWSFSGYYYSGHIHSRSSVRGSHYIIKFDDDTECDVEIANLRRCEFVIGDTVYLMGYKQNGEVVAINRWEREGKIRVEMDEGVEVDVEASVIRISDFMIKEQWSKRTLQASSIVPFLQAVSLKSSPSKSSLVGGTSSAKFLKYCGFVVTLGLGNDNWVDTRDGLVKMIEGKGGTVISDWSSIFELDASHSGKRWSAGQKHMVYNEFGGQDNIRSVFLLADEPNQKPKYLIALALGIPCVSINWLKHSVHDDSLLDWALYLLPAGYCASLGALASQRINMEWGDKAQDMVDIFSSPLASKLFQGKSVLCVGDGMFPPGKNFKRSNSSVESDEKHKEATRTVPRILLAMGAELVEAVLDSKHASVDVSEFDYVVVKEPDDVERFARDGVTCVHLSWLKECLIASKLLPLPSEIN